MIELYIQRHEQVLHDICDKTLIPSNRIREALAYSLFSGGKRIRPVLIYLAGALIHVDIRILDVIAASVELTHCYSLIHDDLPAMDDDDFRRGKLSCHKAYDEATAILTGDGLQALAVEVLLTRLEPLVNPAKIIRIAQILLHSSGMSGMVSGQSLDLDVLCHSSVTEKQLQEIHMLKTGKLFLACFEMIIEAANCVSDSKATKPQSGQQHKITIQDPLIRPMGTFSPGLGRRENEGSYLEAEALRNYANHLGLVFQMQDDYLDYYADENRLGKNRSSDAANQKTTYATLFTKQQLEKKMEEHYQMALNALALFGNNAFVLIELTKKLQARIILENNYG